MFITVRKQMQDAFLALTKNQSVLFITDLDKDLLWDTYLNSFTDPAEKQQHNCRSCRSFIRNYGNVVALVNNKMVTIWNFETIEPFKEMVQNMNQLVLSSKIKDIFLSNLGQVGTERNVKGGGFTTSPIIWNHFFLRLPIFCINKSGKSIESVMGDSRDNKNVFKRSLDEITQDSIETVLELIAQNSLYKGEEFKGVLTEFLKLKREYTKLKPEDQDNYCWAKTQQSGTIKRIRNTSIGTLLTDLSEGKELDKAVEAFERMVAPTNYKRPKSLVTKKMIDEAEKTVAELGLTDALTRRYATPDDISVNNVLFINRDAKKALGVFNELKEDVVVNPRTLKKVEELQIDDFIQNILPTAKSVELLLENNHMNNLVSLITEKNEKSPILFKWNNPFSWSYTNAVADGLREKVVALGGRVDGVFRFTHSWNELEPNQSLMDLHVFMPGCELPKQYHHGPNVNGRRVGWNCRRDTLSGGVQDVDYTNAAPSGYIPVENITFPDLKKMPEGTYTCMINNWSFRGTGGRGKAEIEFGGNVYQYEYPATTNNEWVTIATVTLKNGIFTIEHALKESTSSKTKWDLSTNKFHKVSTIMNSPNHWETKIGNRHTFFLLEGAKNDEQPRGFFNEFLKEELDVHRKVFEVLGGKLKVESADKQLSGVGFSSTQRNSVICKVEGKFERLLKINF